MKKILFSCLLILAGFACGFAQSTSCSTPLGFNTVPGLTITLDTNIVNPDTTNDYGCLATQDNPIWIYLKVCTGGTANILLNAVPSGSGADVDFVAWGPLTAPTDCGLDSTQIVACSNATGPTETVLLTGLVAGDYYKILISNNSNIPGTLYITQSGGSAVFDVSCPSPGCIGAPQQICMVTTDFALNKNWIVWEKDTTIPIAGYVIEKESTVAGVFMPLDTTTQADTSAWLDPVSNPLVQAFRYRISVFDTCGAYFSGIPHKTIHLQTTLGMLGYPQLSWNAYEGFAYGTYFIYRGTLPGSMNVYDSIASSSTTYTDINPLVGTAYYGIGIMPPSPCMPTRSLLMTLSNTTPVTINSIAELQNHHSVVFPNPANNQINFTTQLTGMVLVQLYSADGKQVLQREFNGVNQGTVFIEGLTEGIYLLRLDTTNGTDWHKINVVR